MIALESMEQWQCNAVFLSRTQPETSFIDNSRDLVMKHVHNIESNSCAARAENNSDNIFKFITGIPLER